MKAMLLFIVLVLPLLGFAYQDNGDSISCSQSFSCPVDDSRNPINGTFADPDNCQIYYICISGISWPQQCPPGHHFSPILKMSPCNYRMCVLPHEGSCNTNIATQTLAREKQECLAEIKQEDLSVEYRESNYVCQFDPNDDPINGTYPSPTDCAIYYHCADGVAWPQQCPPDFFYSPSMELDDCNHVTCVTEAEAKCPVNGEWGAWGPWSDCSNECGEGLRLRTRECDNPPAANGGSDCAGIDFDVEVCNGDNCPPEVNTTAVAFFAGKTFDWSAEEAHDPVILDQVQVNLGGVYIPQTHEFVVPSDGNYFMSLSAGALNFRPVHLELVTNTSTLFVDVLRHEKGQNNRDSSGREVILSLKQGDRLHLRGNVGSAIGGDMGLPTSWTVIGYSEMASMESAFSVALQSPMLASNIIVFDSIFSNDGNDYNPVTGRFRCALPGIYYFSFSVAIPSKEKAEIGIRCLGACLQYTPIDITRDHTDFNGVDTVFRGVLYELEIGDDVYITTNHPVFSDGNHQTSFSGLLYEISSPNEGLAWSVAHSKDLPPDLFNNIAFDTIILNQRNAWNPTENHADCSKEGYYFVHISAGAVSSGRVDMRLFKDEVYIADVLRLSSIHRGRDLISRSLIVHCNLGETLKVRAASTLGSGSLNLAISFTGFLIGDSTINFNHELVDNDY